MSETSAAAFIELVSGRNGHFSMESGLHSALWLDLDALFAVPARVEPFVLALAEMLRPLHADVVCGPLLGGAFLAQRIATIVGADFWYTEPTKPIDAAGLYRARYRLPRALASRLSRPRVALVDDVMSAGSSLRATYSEVNSRAEVVGVGSLLQLGTVGADYFGALGIPVMAVAQLPFDSWRPTECPHCAAGVPLETVAAPAA